MTPAHDPSSPLTVLSAPPEGASPVTDPITDGPGLFEIANPDGDNARSPTCGGSPVQHAHPGRGLINAAAFLLGLLDAGLFAVSLTPSTSTSSTPSTSPGPRSSRPSRWTPR